MNVNFKPMLASDWDSRKLSFPLLVQPKIDGVRAINVGGHLVGRSLKPFANKQITANFSKDAFEGFDGELIVGASQTIPDLCRETTSAVNTVSCTSCMTWIVFDDHTAKGSYADRLLQLHNRMEGMDNSHIKVIESISVFSLEELEKCHESFIKKGYEGTIIRSRSAEYKHGRSTVREGGLLRIKDFSDAEGVVVGIEEAMENTNEPSVNALGRSERSSKQEGMLPKGVVGAIVCKDSTGALIKVGPGALSHAERKYYFDNPNLLIGHIIKYKYFPHGIKDKPRFPTFLSVRSEVDIS